MRLSDARTRGPWREKWVQFIRTRDIILTLVRSMDGTVPGQRDAIDGALDMAVEEEEKIFQEIRRALTAGADESTDLVDLHLPSDPESQFQRSPRGSEPESPPPPRVQE